MSKAITDRTQEQPSSQWGPGAELAPSVVREDEPTLARTFGIIGGFLVIFAGSALVLNAFFKESRIGSGWATFLLAAGAVGLLAHAAFDRDLQVRRLYWGAGLGLLGMGALLCVIGVVANRGGLFLVAYPSLLGALLFLLAVLHHETDPLILTVSQRVLGGAGALMAAVAFLLGNNFKGMQFLLPHGVLLALLGLAYLSAFVSRMGIASERGYRTGLAIGALGTIAFLIGLLRSVFATGYLIPNGLLFMGLGLLYVLVAVAYCSDHPFVVMTRRELASYFFSPLIYLVLAGMTVVAWFFYSRLLQAATEFILPEPIIGVYLGFGPFLTVIFLVPVLTMRLLSEEKRSGSLEVLLTAPVRESTVVLSKFLAGLLIYLVLWMPWWLFLVALRVGGGVPFDYRALFSFITALSITGAGFVAMGLFFSSLTRNQVASAVLTFAMMMLFLGLFLLQPRLRETPNNPWMIIVNHVNFVGLWYQAMDGILVPRLLLFHVSAAVIWLFLTVKVLEARRWA